MTTSRPTASGAPATARMIRLYLAVCSLVAGYGIGVLGPGLLPPRFFVDSARIRQYIAAGGGSGRDGSYQGTAELYRLTGLASLPPLVVGHVAFALFVVVLLRCRSLRAVADSRSVPELLLFCVSPLLAGVFLFTVTKEFFVLVVVAVVVLALPRGPAAEATAVASMLAYAAAVREYWFIVAAFYVGLRFAVGRRGGPVRVLLTVLAGFVVLAVAFPAFLGVPTNHFRTSVVDDLSVSPGSLIVDPFPATGVLGQVANATYVFGTLQLPVPVLLSSGQQLAGGLVIVLFWALLWRRFGGAAGRPVAGTRILCLLVAYVATLALFEPDYGSYLRHLTPLLPLVLWTSVPAAVEPQAAPVAAGAPPDRVILTVPGDRPSG